MTRKPIGSPLLCIFGFGSTPILASYCLFPVCSTISAIVNFSKTDRRGTGWIRKRRHTRPRSSENANFDWWPFLGVSFSIHPATPSLTFFQHRHLPVTHGFPCPILVGSARTRLKPDAGEPASNERNSAFHSRHDWIPRRRNSRWTTGPKKWRGPQWASPSPELHPNMIVGNQRNATGSMPSILYEKILMGTKDSYDSSTIKHRNTNDTAWTAVWTKYHLNFS